MPTPTRLTNSENHALDLEPAELEQPSINVQTQFNLYNKKYFSNRIINTTVEYSTRMTLCAGTCTFRPPNVRIALSEPILKFRPRSDLLSTLLHEMIHAFLFLTQRLSRDGPDGHGPIFMSHAHRINALEPDLQITPYHDFSAEVDHYRVHHWRCQECRHLIKRAMNRAPAPTDTFWPAHQQKCGGQYIKIAGPPKKQRPIRPPKNRAIAVDSNHDKTLPKGVMKTFRIDRMLSGSVQKPPVMVSCPVCAVPVKQDRLNDHLDLCLAESMSTQPANLPPPQQHDPPHSEKGNASRVDAPQVPTPVSKPKPIYLAEHDISLPPVPATSDVTPQKPNPPVNNSYQTNSPKVFDVMKYIADSKALYHLALTPKKYPPEQINKIFKDLPHYPPEPSNSVSKTGIKDFLHTLIHPQSPSSKEQQAKAIIKPLKFGPNDEDFSFYAASKRLSMSWAELQRLIQQNSSRDQYGNILVSEDVVDMLCSSHSPDTKHANSWPHTAPNHSRNNASLEQENVTGLYPKRKRGSCAIRSDSNDGIQPDLNRRHRNECRNPKRQAGANKCPTCQTNVGQHGLGEHMKICASGSQGRESDHTAGNPSSEPETVHANPRAALQTLSRQRDTKPQKSHRCPICDIALSRQQLEAHVASCMMSTGLADAF